MHTDQDPGDEVFMRLRGTLAELMVKVNTSLYRKYVSEGKNGEPILYVRLLKALYGQLKAALVFYKKLSGELEQAGFKKNPYDPCVMNKIVKGKQLTVVWHVDDLKISHVILKVVTRVIKWLDCKYPGVTSTRGKKHQYLGMQFDFSTKGEVNISMVPYVEQVIEDFMEPITTSSATPAT